ncbi:helix-turn-helix domain-containing protein [Streptomyces roseirectus]|uniref:Helix-turn-helix domain-containing protein n=1 Tax=Streptomyces roseirectus TaxID=2768066 RepID=A0A7H0IEA4_9ACTN|nr:helix-turn-helix domain-containing protein [Streptomyces roseirectus]QNP71120.1 helix-turn-helix domain-containing protein [Streptomyces roseirectus]
MNETVGARHRVHALTFPRGGVHHAHSRPATGPVREPLDPGNSWLLQLRPHDPDALHHAVSDTPTLREARLLIGDGAVGWAVEVAARMAAAGAATGRPPGTNTQPPSRSTHRPPAPGTGWPTARNTGPSPDGEPGRLLDGVATPSPDRLAGRTPDEAADRLPGQGSGWPASGAAGPSPYGVTGRAPGRGAAGASDGVTGRPAGRDTGRPPGGATVPPPGPGAGWPTSAAAGPSPDGVTGRAPGRGAGRLPGGVAVPPPGRVAVLPRVPADLGARGAEALALYVLTCLAGYTADDLPEAVGVSVREATRRGLPAGGTFDVLKGQLDCLVRELFHACEDLLGPAEAADVTRTLSGALVAEVQHILLTLAEQAEHERRGWFGSAAAHHQELVLDILDGTDIDAPQAFLRLGYDISRSHLALIVWRDDWDAHGTADLAAAATTLLRGAGCSSLLTVPVGVSSLWAWGARTRGNPLSLRQLRDAEGPHRQVPGVHIAAGLPGEGIEGFRTSHRQAGEAAELIRAAGPGAGGQRSPYDYADLELAVLLRSRPDLSAGFVRRELGPLAGEDMAELRTTVKCYLDLERSMSAVAGRLHIAKSSVAYRIRKAERLLGRPVQEDRLRLHSALLLFDVLGKAALDA